MIENRSTSRNLRIVDASSKRRCVVQGSGRAADMDARLGPAGSRRNALSATVGAEGLFVSGREYVARGVNGLTRR
jgi:hypothetical protein